MAQTMHIVKPKLLRSPQGRVRTYCGTVLARGEGAPETAPMCAACMRAAGWTRDTRGSK